MGRDRTPGQRRRQQSQQPVLGWRRVEPPHLGEAISILGLSDELGRSIYRYSSSPGPYMRRTTEGTAPNRLLDDRSTALLEAGVHRFGRQPEFDRNPSGAGAAR